MKNLMGVCYLFLFVAAMAISLSSCGGTTCYECTGPTGDSSTTCEGDIDEDGNEITEELLEAGVALIRAFGGTCNKK